MNFLKLTKKTRKNVLTNLSKIQSNQLSSMTSFKTPTINSVSDFALTTQAPPDPILSLNTLFKQDTFKDKISVGVGAYRTEKGSPLILDCVKKVFKTNKRLN